MLEDEEDLQRKITIPFPCNQTTATLLPPKLWIRARVHITQETSKEAAWVSLCLLQTLPNQQGRLTTLNLVDEEDLQEENNSSFFLHSNHCHSPPPKTVDLSSCAYHLRNFERGSVTLSLSVSLLQTLPDPQGRLTPLNLRGAWGIIDSRNECPLSYGTLDLSVCTMLGMDHHATCYV